ncbi:hypothetical protein LCH21_03635 [Patescibacteria group bacterium]|jgi:uncharacterized membrane protein YeaQ/YmgE (transglycosylase-associated protein family)|nr:hypothetical protein [Patescibacteria group bacterium]
MNKLLITIGATIGSTVGALLPQLWGDHDFLSLASLSFGFIGGVVGIWLGVKAARQLS